MNSLEATKYICRSPRFVILNHFLILWRIQLILRVTTCEGDIVYIQQNDSHHAIFMKKIECVIDVRIYKALGSEVGLYRGVPSMRGLL